MVKLLVYKIKSKIPVDFSQVFFFDILSKVFMLAITIILIRFMVPAEYADIVKFTALSSFNFGVFGEGIALTFIRYSTEQFSRGKKNSLALHTKVSLMLLILSIIAIGLAPLLAKVYNMANTVVIYSIIYGFLIALINMNLAYFQSRELYVQSGMINNIKNIFILLGIGSFLLIFHELRVISVILLFIFSSIVTFCYGLYKIYKSKQVKNILLDFYDFKLMIKESLWVLVYLILLNLFNQMDIIMISNLLTNKDVALYGIAFKYYSLLLTLLPSIKAVLRVRTSKVEFVDSKEHRKEFVLQWLKKTWFIVFLSCVVIILLSGLFMPHINGHQYDDAIPAFNILVVGVGISYMFASNISIMMSARRYKELCFLAAISLAFNVFSNWLLIPIYGINAAAATTIVSHAILNMSTTLFIIYDKRELKV
ncbi:oligosaccharide flippase family protein [Radiobacillus deserti]|nr:oligosaccharide flippase family protein [Radiobacillus deserti]